MAVILRRRLAESLYDRRLVALFISAGVALLAHRIAASRLGTPAGHVVAEDLVVLAVLYGTAAITFDRWMGWLAALALAGGAVGTYEPAWAPTALALCTLTGIPVMLAFWRRA